MQLRLQCVVVDWTLVDLGGTLALSSKRDSLLGPRTTSLVGLILPCENPTAIINITRHKLARASCPAIFAHHPGMQ